MHDPATRPTTSPAEAALEELEATLPPICWTADEAPWRLIGISPKTVQNLVSQGRGPKPTIRLGRRTGFRKVDLLRWLRDRLTVEADPSQARALEGQRPRTGGEA